MAHDLVSPGPVPIGLRPRTTMLRTAFVVNAGVAAVGLALKFAAAQGPDHVGPATALVRAISEASYFTIQSNLLVLGVCVVLAWFPERWPRVAGAARLSALVCITVTAAVYYTLLAGDEALHGSALVADVLVHAVSPALFVGTFLALGPHGAMRWSDVPRALVFPLGWVALTLLRGPVVHWYPYDFIDVRAHGYGPVLAAVAALVAAAAGLAAGAVALDRRAGGQRPSSSCRP